MKKSSLHECSFEEALTSTFLGNGYQNIPSEKFDRERAIFPGTILEFIRETQPQWEKLEALHGEKTGERVLHDLCKWMDAHGSLATLRHGFKCYGRTLRIAFFKAAHNLNRELEARYEANRLGVTRQLHFSPKSEQSLDVTLSVNGIPVASLELKNPLTAQTVDTEVVYMTTRLSGSPTHFLPFNRGVNGGAGNPLDEQGRSYRTSYLWEEVLQRDSLLDLIARFLHIQVEERFSDEGKKVKKETLIFPRYHQLQTVRSLVSTSGEEGPGNNYLVEHSAGSGKSNTIAWLAHRLSSLHDSKDKRVFDSVIVVTDRRVLDKQLQDTIYQFEHRQGVVQKIDEDSQQLAQALENAVPIIITTQQKFPFVSGHLLKMAEERGRKSGGRLPTRREAVIIDEAHSSQSGETETNLKEVLGGEDLFREAQQKAAEEGVPHLEELFRSMAKRGKQANLSFFAFTATPKHKTLAIFGRNGEPFHRYTMRQAIEEEFIMDVLLHYTRPITGC